MALIDDGGANWGCYGPSLVPVLPQASGDAQHPQHLLRYGPDFTDFLVYVLRNPHSTICSLLFSLHSSLFTWLPCSQPITIGQTNNIRISNNSYLACLTGRRLVDQLAEAHMRGLSCSSFSSMIWKQTLSIQSLNLQMMQNYLPESMTVKTETSSNRTKCQVMHLGRTNKQSIYYIRSQKIETVNE